MEKIQAKLFGKEITFVESPVVVCNNSDYVIEFEFDDDWAGIDLKTARFVCVANNSTKFIDIVFTGTVVALPIFSGVSKIYFGVFAGNIVSTTKSPITVKESILCDTGYPVDPEPDVYLQILELFANVKGDSIFVRYSSNPDGTDFTEEWTEEKNYIGIATGLLVPTNKEDYQWIRFKGDDGEPGAATYRGYSAYEIACQKGFEGTEEEWLASLKGEPGDTPVYGEDYFTEDEINDMVEEVLSRVVDGNEVAY